MGDKDPEKAAWRRLVAATSALGGIGVVGTAIPFVASLASSERAHSAGELIEVDLAKLEPRQLATVE